ncbi:N-formylglutamate amidohydrolase [Entomobacter blattae]|uniref:N-formylglutamate amidohydrolase n=1 Tax=Entomobacter blattae TaxID=2762277 RepID=A0A7H1NRB7_9PROT|nr:N-formylglutamate amidohydrolase [Entomobacter blattae]QNT78327.1 N-formylglutamate amidohydrolase [Entomobacter blattae]
MPSPPVYSVFTPSRAFSTPLILCSGHSGRHYEDHLLAQTSLSLEMLRQSEDAFVDQILEPCPDLGCQLLMAHFPRIFCDPNREEWELDPDMFSSPLPAGCNTTTSRVQNGIGTFHRFAVGKHPLYREKLPLEEAYTRLKTYWRPYHQTLEALVEDCLHQHGVCVILDFHSMPQWPGHGPDFVLGTGYGTSCALSLVREIETFLLQKAYLTRRDFPYAGGYTTLHYGRPHRNIHTLQIEISRTLYMKTAPLQTIPAFQTLQADLMDLLSHFISYLQHSSPLPTSS